MKYKFVLKALAEALKEEKIKLRNAYLEAEQDEDRIKTIKDWEILDGQE